MTRRLCLHRNCSSLRCRPFTEPKWRNGRRAGFKILYPLLGVWVRLPPSALFASVLKNLGSSGVFAFLVVAVFGSVDCDAGGSV